jgi:hypothetical protein
MNTRIEPLDYAFRKNNLEFLDESKGLIFDKDSKEIIVTKASQPDACIVISFD